MGDRERGVRSRSHDLSRERVRRPCGRVSRKQRNRRGRNHRNENGGQLRYAQEVAQEAHATSSTQAPKDASTRSLERVVMMGGWFRTEIMRRSLFRPNERRALREQTPTEV